MIEGYVSHKLVPYCFLTNEILHHGVDEYKNKPNYGQFKKKLNHDGHDDFT